VIVRGAPDYRAGRVNLPVVVWPLEIDGPPAVAGIANVR
jgi:hypothetical protein